MQRPSRPFVSIIMPALNEERYIVDAISSIEPELDALDYEILILDGGSRDRTREIVEEIAAKNARIRLIHNDRRIQSAAINIASEACDPRAAIFVRADCHAKYPRNFVARAIEALRRAESSSVVVPMRAVGCQPMQRAIAAAQNSWLGNGGSRHRAPGHSGYVDHGHHAAFDRATFRALGGYDETAPVNEDAEFDARLLRSGGRIYLDGTLTIDYYPRASLRTLARQYFKHGWGRANTLLKHGQRPKIRQMLPLLILLACAGGIALWPLVGFAALLPMAIYAGSCLVWAVVLSLRARDAAVLMAAPASVAMHLSWAVGFLVRMAGHRAPHMVKTAHGL